MNAIRCPHCHSINQMSATQCQKCRMPFGNLPTTAYVSVPVEQIYEAQVFGGGFNPPSVGAIPTDNETGRKAFLWYRVYCGALTVLYLLFAVGGAALAILQPPLDNQSPQETLIMGAIYGALGAIFFVVFAVALFLPRKPYNWIVGIVMMAFGMTSCCFWPFLIPLLIYWVKPETKAYFGRN